MLVYMNCRERAEECLWKVSRSLDQRSRSQLHLKFSPQITEQMKFSVYLLVFQFYIRHRFQWSYKVCFVSLFIFNFFSSIWYHTTSDDPVVASATTSPLVIIIIYYFFSFFFCRICTVSSSETAQPISFKFSGLM